jgi:hypothetical protein
MVTPLLDRVVSAFLEKSFEINITGGNDVAWGFALVAIGLAYHLSTTSIYELVGRKEKLALLQKQIGHDKAIFLQANELMSGDFLSDFIYWIGNDHSYQIEDTRKLERFCQYLARDENQFLHKELVSATQELLKSSAKFLEFSAYKFFNFPVSQMGENPRLCMVPALNIDREGDGSPEQAAKYDALTNELESLIDNLRERYRAFRTEVKKALII